MDYTFYNRNLPHRLPAGEQLFLTLRLAGSLPRSVVAALRAEAEAVEAAALRQPPDGAAAYRRQKQYFGRFDAMLDAAATGPLWLRRPPVAALVGQAFHHYDGRCYELLAYCIMANHVHAVLSLPEPTGSFMRTLQRLKSYTALEANRLLGRTGQFWQRETYDHIIRDGEEMQRVLAYVVNNPVKAGLIENWQQWPHTYWREQ
ncbi:REP-associated tyrosine transposase [Hymenobacter sp.]|jgi:REP element-mobilizing transposase RayT|uniref:REP-associated tyrosine transposase n=1 Tax=Hymenobacter sp. TaxID=1898978 RepID=UPI002ED78772